MYIGELATRTGVPPRLLRYYEEQGLLQTRRDFKGYRLYSDDDVETVNTIRCLLSAGVPTRLISLLLPDVEPGQSPLDITIDLATRNELVGYRNRLRDRHELVSASLAAIDNYLARACYAGG
jgi:DNA-binding transcriptional MerR regulator